MCEDKNESSPPEGVVITHSIWNSSGKKYFSLSTIYSFSHLYQHGSCILILCFRLWPSTMLLILLLKLFQVWPFGTLWSGISLKFFYHFIYSISLLLGNIRWSRFFCWLIFALVLEPTISPKCPGSFLLENCIQKPRAR